ncbi:MAG: DUF2442 domain-containing protein [Rubrivivax sp.]|nr:DUF2442 domain-containing protein [Rubrivivax sp.]
MPRITEATYAGDYKVALRFDTQEAGIVDLHELIHKYEAAAPLRDPAAFARFRLDDWPTLVWDCGFDVSPETLYARATGKPVQWTTDDSLAEEGSANGQLTGNGSNGMGSGLKS